MKIKIQRFNTLTNDSKGFQADEIKNDPSKATIKATIEGQKVDREINIPSLGFALTEATIFAPWRPWYTGHYCAKDQDDISNAVCYEDYFTTQLIAANLPWLIGAPASFYPKEGKEQFINFCKSGVDSCDMYLGKVDWVKSEIQPQINSCGDETEPTNQPNDKTSCQGVVNARTAKLDFQFKASLTEFIDTGRYLWYEPELVLVPPVPPVPPEPPLPPELPDPNKPANWKEYYSDYSVYNEKYNLYIEDVGYEPYISKYIRPNPFIGFYELDSACTK